MSDTPEITEYLSYDQETGFFTWRKILGGRTKIGSIAGTKLNTGYVQIKFNGKFYLAHRLAFFFVTGEFPVDDVDHRNGMKADNRFCNLRLATTSQNLWNAKVRKDSFSGVKGITYMKENRTWRARIKKMGVFVFHKNFKTLEEAREAITAQRKIHHGEFARHQ